jgi:hypothetical protein
LFGVLCQPAESNLSEHRMVKKYQVLRERIPTSEGGFVEALRVALVEFACLGERRFDISGYPHSSAHDALLSDWQALAHDARSAVRKVETEGATDGEGQASRQYAK